MSAVTYTEIPFFNFFTVPMFRVRRPLAMELHLQIKTFDSLVPRSTIGWGSISSEDDDG